MILGSPEDVGRTALRAGTCHRMWFCPPLVYPVIFFFLADRPEPAMLSHDRMDCPSLLFGIAIYQVDFSFETGIFFVSCALGAGMDHFFQRGI